MLADVFKTDEVMIETVKIRQQSKHLKGYAGMDWHSERQTAKNIRAVGTCSKIKDRTPKENQDGWIGTNGVWAKKGGLITPIASLLLATRYVLKHIRGKGGLVRCLQNFLSPNGINLIFGKVSVMYKTSCSMSYKDRHYILVQILFKTLRPMLRRKKALSLASHFKHLYIIRLGLLGEIKVSLFLDTAVRGLS